VSTLIFVLALLGVAVTGGLFAACLGLPRCTDFLLAAWLIGFADVVALALLLSPEHAFTRNWLLAGLAVVLGAALLTWQRRGRPRPPSSGAALAALRDTLRDPVLAVLAVAVALGLAYSAALLLFTAPNDFDALWYHLARAAFWKQQHAVAYVDLANDKRINVFPPFAEIGVAFTMVLDQSDLFVGLVQFLALPATMLGIFGIARRLGFERRPALYSTLVFGTFPVVALQASTALNDLVVASFLVAAVCFAFSLSRTSLGLAVLALGLAVGAKATALLALPVVALVLAFTHPRSRWLRIVLAGLAGIALGAVWYVLNVVETGAPGGKFGGAGMEPDREAPGGAAAAARLGRMIVDAIDPAGSVGRDRFLYVITAALVLAVGALVALHLRRRALLGVALAAAVLALLPLAVHPLHNAASRADQKLFLVLGSHRLAYLGSERLPTQASPFGSWYGPLGLVLFLVALPFVVQGVRRKTLPRVALVLALTPALFVVVLAVLTFYSAFGGRYVMFAVALACSTWGVLLRVRAIAWASGAVAATAMLLAFVHYTEKPAGFSVLGHGTSESVWGRSDLVVQSFFLNQGATEAAAALYTRAGSGASVGLRIAQNDLSYPYFGSHLDRKVLFVGLAGQNVNQVEWLVVASGQSTEACRTDWRRVPGVGHGWALYRRVARNGCAGELSA
jgi:4-amino-4-deoxy-L-arabinose transferase-like glycosyltransferase